MKSNLAVWHSTKMMSCPLTTKSDLSRWNRFCQSSDDFSSQFLNYHSPTYICTQRGTHTHIRYIYISFTLALCMSEPPSYLQETIRHLVTEIFNLLSTGSVAWRICHVKLWKLAIANSWNPTCTNLPPTFTVPGYIWCSANSSHPTSVSPTRSHPDPRLQ
jgi:hypothetical protein